MTTGSSRFDGSAREAARLVIGGLEGAMLVTRLHDDPGAFDTTARHLLAALGPVS